METMILTAGVAMSIAMTKGGESGVAFEAISRFREYDDA